MLSQKFSKKVYSNKFNQVIPSESFVSGPKIDYEGAKNYSYFSIIDDVDMYSSLDFS